MQSKERAIHLGPSSLSFLTPENCHHHTKRTFTGPARSRSWHSQRQESASASASRTSPKPGTSTPQSSTSASSTKARNTVSFQFQNYMINVLAVPMRKELRDIEPLKNRRLQLLAVVEDLDVFNSKLEQYGVGLSVRPVTLPRGQRTLTFVDPGGHSWEVGGKDSIFTDWGQAGACSYLRNG